MVVPTGQGTGLTTTVLGLFHAFARQNIKVHFFKPIAQPQNGDTGCDRSIEILQPACSHPIANPIPIREAEHLVSTSRGDELLEEIVSRFERSAAPQDTVVIIEGMVPTPNQPYATRINKEIAKALDADVVLVAFPGGDTPEALDDHIDITARAYGGIRNPKVLGCILNKLGAPVDRNGNTQSGSLQNQEASPSLTEEQVRQHCQLFSKGFKLLGCIPWQASLTEPRVKDIANYLQADLINPGEIARRRISRISLCARTVANMVNELQPGTLVITPGDRDDIILAASIAALKGIDLAALLLTGGFTPNAGIMDLCREAQRAGLPILSVPGHSLDTVFSLSHYHQEVPADDVVRIEQIKDTTASHIDSQWLQQFCGAETERRLSPPAFRYQLIERARKAARTIVLPEGNEPRTIKAASICAERGIARCVLLGDKEDILKIAAGQGVILGEGVEIFQPDKIRSHYVERYVALRKHKGVTPMLAEEQLRDNVTLGTMMLEMGHVDGLVSGAVHTTANTIRPPLQLIKTAPGCNLVSSIFFMCLPDQVLVYGDCAINPEPNAAELADIAIQSADSAAAFGIPPRVAMISYSTMGSGQGAEVEKVREATRIAREKRPDLLIDGPLQYDAAITETVAKSKAPGSSVAGRATVFIFPDLNTGNTTYKAVQRSADVISIGPMLQGMRKPVNDLSRGALIDDIVFTIALTAIQAASTPQ